MWDKFETRDLYFQRLVRVATVVADVDKKEENKRKWT